ncbi:MAG: hypothetical protein GOU97_03585, partial [Nanoarchaeota archaeon]|nr:hypothetical protein [Nanoarchaeota archaeon]
VADKETFESTYYNLFDKLVGVGGFKVWKQHDFSRYSRGSEAWTASRGNQRSQMQQASQLLVAINEVSKLLMGMYKDLGRIKEALGYYGDKSTPSEIVLKSLWADLIDAKKGVTSIHGMAKGDLQMLMLRDYFYHVNAKNDEEIDQKVEAIETTERIKIVLKRKFKEFLDWKKRWKEELEKAKPLIEERITAQEETIKMYKEWARPLISDVQNLVLGLKHKPGEHLDPGLIEIGKTVISNVLMLAWKGYDDPSKDDEKKKFNSLFPEKDKNVDDWIPAAKYIIKKGLSEYGWYVPVMEISFDFSGSTSPGIAYPTQLFDTTLTMELKIYDLPAFIKKRKELQEDVADKWFDKVLAPVITAKEDSEKKKEAKSEPFTSVKNAMNGFNDFLRKLSGDHEKNPDMRVLAISDLKDSAFNVYEKFKKAQGQLTWGDRAPPEVE